MTKNIFYKVMKIQQMYLVHYGRIIEKESPGFSRFKTPPQKNPYESNQGCVSLFLEINLWGDISWTLDGDKLEVCD